MKKNLFANYIRHLFCSWLIAVSSLFLCVPAMRDLTTVSAVSPTVFILFIVFTVLLSVLFSFLSMRFWRFARLEALLMLILSAMLVISGLVLNFSWPFFIGCVLVVALASVFAFSGWNSKAPKENVPEDAPGKHAEIVVIMLSVLFFLFVSGWTIAKLFSFSSPAFDFGIFTQMFERMRKTGLPTTTVERDGLLSHFAVHMSPIYYLFLPFYAIIPSPITLQVLQAAVMTSAVIPLWKIARNHGLSSVETVILCALLFLFPAFSGGAAYDLHENCFLTPLIFWLFYAIEKRKYLLAALPALLILAVKEDASVYTAVIGLWLFVTELLHEKDKKMLCLSGALFLVSVFYFVSVTGYLSSFGDGVMSGRYENFMVKKTDSLMTVIKTVIMNPLKVIYECFEAKKLEFLAYTMLPLLGLPLMTRRYERYLLLIPYVLFNLMSDYAYQHDIFFQYAFGSSAFLFYLAIINLEELRPVRCRFVWAVAALAVSSLLFGFVTIPKAAKYPNKIIEHRDEYRAVRSVLSTIPEEASVTAFSFYVPWLSKHEVLYDFSHCSRMHLLESDYVILKKSADSNYKKYATWGKENGWDNLVSILETHDFVLLPVETEDAMVFRRMSPGD